MHLIAILYSRFTDGIINHNRVNLVEDYGHSKGNDISEVLAGICHDG